MLFGTWLRSVRAREQESGVDHRELACYGSKLTPHVQSHLSEALQGLEQVYMRIPSVVLDEEELRELWPEFRAEYIREARRALDHIAAALTAVGCTEEELAGADGSPEPAEKNDDPSDIPPEEEASVIEETVQLPVLVSAIEDGADDGK